MAKTVEVKKVKKVKTIQVSQDTWKALSQIKLDVNALTMDEVIKRMVRDAGY